MKAKTFEDFASDHKFELYERQFSEEKRKELAEKGFALQDGSYPIENVADLENAIHAFGRAKDSKAVATHIKKRANALNRIDLIPNTSNFK